MLLYWGGMLGEGGLMGRCYFFAADEEGGYSIVKEFRLIWEGIGAAGPGKVQVMGALRVSVRVGRGFRIGVRWKEGGAKRRAESVPGTH